MRKADIATPTHAETRSVYAINVYPVGLYYVIKQGGEYAVIPAVSYRRFESNLARGHDVQQAYHILQCFRSAEAY